MALGNLKDALSKIVNRFVEKEQSKPFNMFKSVDQSKITPISSRRELEMILSSPYWSDPVALSRLAATFPVLDHAFVTMNEKDYNNMVNYVNTYPELTPDGFASGRVVALFSSIKQNIPLNEVAANLEQLDNADTIDNRIWKSEKGLDAQQLESMRQGIINTATIIRANNLSDYETFREACRGYENQLDTLIESAKQRDAYIFDGAHEHIIDSLGHQVQAADRYERGELWDAETILSQYDDGIDITEE